MGKQNNVAAAFVKRKASCDVLRTPQRCASNRQMIDRKSAIQIKRRCIPNVSSVTNKKDLSVETDNCILRRLYKRRRLLRDKIGHNPFANEVKNSSAYISLEDGSACGDQHSSSFLSTLFAPSDLETLAVHNLQKLLNDYMERHLLENEEIKEKIEETFNTIMQKIKSKSTSTSPTSSRYDAKTVPFICRHCNKTALSETKTGDPKGTSRITIPFRCKKLRVLSTLTVPRAYCKKKTTHITRKGIYTPFHKCSFSEMLSLNETTTSNFSTSCGLPPISNTSFTEASIDKTVTSQTFASATSKRPAQSKSSQQPYYASPGYLTVLRTQVPSNSTRTPNIRYNPSSLESLSSTAFTKKTPCSIHSALNIEKGDENTINTSTSSSSGTSSVDVPERSHTSPTQKVSSTDSLGYIFKRSTKLITRQFSLLTLKSKDDSMIKKIYGSGSATNELLMNFSRISSSLHGICTKNVNSSLKIINSSSKFIIRNQNVNNTSNDRISFRPVTFDKSDDNKLSLRDALSFDIVTLSSNDANKGTTKTSALCSVSKTLKKSCATSTRALCSNTASYSKTPTVKRTTLSLDDGNMYTIKSANENHRYINQPKEDNYINNNKPFNVRPRPEFCKIKKQTREQGVNAIKRPLTVAQIQTDDFVTTDVISVVKILEPKLKVDNETSITSDFQLSENINNTANLNKVNSFSIPINVNHCQTALIEESNILNKPKKFRRKKRKNVNKCKKLRAVHLAERKPSLKCVPSHHDKSNPDSTEIGTLCEKLFDYISFQKNIIKKHMNFDVVINLKPSFDDASKDTSAKDAFNVDSTNVDVSEKSKKKPPVEEYNNLVQPNIINLLDGSVKQNQYLSIASVSTQSDDGDHSSQSIETYTTTIDNSTMMGDRHGLLRRKPYIEVVSQYTNTYDLEIAKEINELRSVLKILASAADKFLSDNNSKKIITSNEPLKIEAINTEDSMPSASIEPTELPTVTPSLPPPVDRAPSPVYTLPPQVNIPLLAPVISPAAVKAPSVLQVAPYVPVEDALLATPLPTSSLPPVNKPSSVELKKPLLNIVNSTKATQIKQTVDFNLADYLSSRPRKKVKRCTSYDIFASEEILKATDMTSANEIFDFDRAQTSEATYCCLPKSRSLFELSTSTSSRAKLLNLFWNKYFEKNNIKDPFKQKMSTTDNLTSSSTHITKIKPRYMDRHNYPKTSKKHSVKIVESNCKDEESDDENVEISISVVEISPTVKEPLPKHSSKVLSKPIEAIDSNKLRTINKADRTNENLNADAESLTLFKNPTNFDIAMQSFDSNKDDSWEESQVEIGASSYFGKAPTSVCFSCVSHSRYTAEKFESKQSKIHASPKFNSSSTEYSSVTFSNPADGGDAPRKQHEDTKTAESSDVVKNVIGGASSSFIVEISSSEKGSDQNVMSEESLSEKSSKRWCYYSAFLVVVFILIFTVVYIYLGGKKIKLWKRAHSRMNKRPRYRKLSEYGF